MPQPHNTCPGATRGARRPEPLPRLAPPAIHLPQCVQQAAPAGL